MAQSRGVREPLRTPGAVRQALGRQPAGIFKLAHCDAVAHSRNSPVSKSLRPGIDRRSWQLRDGAAAQRQAQRASENDMSSVHALKCRQIPAAECSSTRFPYGPYGTGGRSPGGLGAGELLHPPPRDGFVWCALVVVRRGAVALIADLVGT